MNDRKQTGRIGLVEAISYYTENGYTVSIPLTDTQWYDIIIEKDGNILTVQCKATETKENSIDFRSTGGTKGVPYDNILEHSKLDMLFCVDSERNCYSIPVNVLRKYKNKNSICLRKERKNTENKGCFPSYKFLVKLGR
jgi:hypothetical protein